MTLKNIRAVLVHTSHPGNIGAAARALKTMGLHQLYLVAPELFPHPEATARAAGGVDVLENAVVVDTLLEAVGDVQLVIATTSRHRTIERPVLNPRAAGQLLIKEAAQRPVALLFGSEQHGLTNVELELCQYQVHIPAAADYGVLNLAAAVQVLAYEIRLASLDLMATNEHDLAELDFATIAELESFYQHLADVVQELGVLNPAQPRQLMQRLRVLFGRTRLDKTELNILRGILKAMQKRL
jgi:tRNA (cytidine32/uridine32-2'-O)-methyltransferase